MDMPSLKSPWVLGGLAVGGVLGLIVLLKGGGGKAGGTGGNTGADPAALASTIRDLQESDDATYSAMQAAFERMQSSFTDELLKRDAAIEDILDHLSEPPDTPDTPVTPPSTPEEPDYMFTAGFFDAISRWMGANAPSRWSKMGDFNELLRFTIQPTDPTGADTSIISKANSLFTEWYFGYAHWTPTADETVLKDAYARFYEQAKAAATGAK